MVGRLRRSSGGYGRRKGIEVNLMNENEETDKVLADTLIARLNKLCEDPEVLRAVGSLLELEVWVSERVADHPTIQVGPGNRLRFLGLLNGILGSIPEGRFAGWGHVAARYDEGKLVGFTRVGA